MALAITLVGCERATHEGATHEAATPAGHEPAPSASAVVTYSVDVRAPADAVSPSTPVVAQLAQDPNLGRLTVSDGAASDGPPTRELQVEFAFGTVDAYLAWREQANTRALLDGMAALAADPAKVQARLSVRRPSLYRTIIGRVATGSGSAGRRVESVACNEDCSQIDVAYRTRGNEAGGGGPAGGTGDAGDIDAVTLVCQPGLAGTIEKCTASN